jgi:hypothetical protein
MAALPVPALPTPATSALMLSGSCSTLSQDTGSGGAAPGCPREPGYAHPGGHDGPASSYHLAAARRAAREPAAGVLTPAARPGGRPVTTKSASTGWPAPGRSNPVS